MIRRIRKIIIVTFAFLLLCIFNSKILCLAYKYNDNNPIEYNPNYIGRETVGDLEEKYLLRRKVNGNNFDSFSYKANNDPTSVLRPNQNHDFDHHQQQNPYYSSFTTTRKKPKPFLQVISNFFREMNSFSPTLFYITCTSILIHILWQIPLISISTLLQKHFLCSRNHVVGHYRIWTLLLSAVSHASLYHLAVNLYGFYIFGTSVLKSMRQSNLYPQNYHHRHKSINVFLSSLWPFCLISAIVSSLCFLLFEGGRSSCMGLSGITLALLALDSRIHPAKELSFFVKFFPIRLPAQYALYILLGWSVLGSISPQRDRIAHAAHLGGLLSGIVYYEVFSRRSRSY